MTVVVVAGAVTVLQFARAADLSPWLTAPLLLLGAVAVPSIGAELAVARREEIGLARLRGIHGLRLWRFLLLEPLLAIVVGALVGLALGAVGTVLATKTWLDEAADPWGRPALLATAAIAGVGLVIVGVSAAAALREPLAVQVSTRRRPRRATTLAIFLSVLVFVGAGVASYRSRGADGEPDLVVLVGPALVGLALGQLAIWVIRIAARGLTPTTERRGMGAFLAARRLARADDLVTPIRLVVAAAVVGSLALSGAVSVSGWTDDQSRVEVPGARVITADTGAMGAVELTERVDPDATHLIATAIVRNEDRLPERRAYVDADRWDAVVGGFYDGTPARAASDAVDRLSTDADPFQVKGDRLTVTASGIDVPKVRFFIGPDGERVPFGGGNAELTLHYVTSANATGSAAVTFVVPRDGGSVTKSVRVRDCAKGCTITGIDVARGADVVFDNRGMTFLVHSFTLGDTDLSRRTWIPDPGAIETLLGNNFFPGYEPPRDIVVNRPDGLQVALLPSVTLELNLDVGSAVPALVADESKPQALDLGGDDRATDVIGVARTLPLLGSIGLLTDIRTSAVGSGPTVPSAEVQVVAAAGTPQAMLDEVAKATGSSWRTFDSVRDALGEQYGGAQSVAYALTALACALVALLALGAGVARHLRDYRRDVASLRVLGISVATARRAGRAELISLTLLVLGIVVAGGWLAVTLLLGGIPLLSNPAAGMPVDTTPHLWPLAVPAVIAAVAVVLVGGRARAVRSATTQPSLLREEEGR
ncbi:hypothetical protein J2X46_002192 [Nocardioides sp. BE266]|uniref:ABC transporter permease n=1 Tax=Nocardioides sp. BE266 TaxID=2817725 RepID=UPI0028592625|nr:hypothetical protein [Nocardioides sp. BE266]MDR7253207.1 hypothetical protein [Nocardioides sp. BE266]